LLLLVSFNQLSERDRAVLFGVIRSEVFLSEFQTFSFCAGPGGASELRNRTEDFASLNPAFVTPAKYPNVVTAGSSV
jgi:hypothetical protein